MNLLTLKKKLLSLEHDEYISITMNNKNKTSAIHNETLHLFPHLSVNNSCITTINEGNYLHNINEDSIRETIHSISQKDYDTLLKNYIKVYSGGDKSKYIEIIDKLDKLAIKFDITAQDEVDELRNELNSIFTDQFVLEFIEYFTYYIVVRTHLAKHTSIQSFISLAVIAIAVVVMTVFIVM